VTGRRRSPLPMGISQAAARALLGSCDDAAALIHQVSRGLPRAVNNLALQSLIAAYAADKTIVDEQSARAAVAEVTSE
jgi:type II secretory pathway predicted ATPase ExeA